MPRTTVVRPSTVDDDGPEPLAPEGELPAAVGVLNGGRPWRLATDLGFGRTGVANVPSAFVPDERFKLLATGAETPPKVAGGWKLLDVVVWWEDAELPAGVGVGALTPAPDGPCVGVSGVDWAAVSEIVAVESGRSAETGGSRR